MTIDVKGIPYRIDDGHGTTAKIDLQYRDEGDFGWSYTVIVVFDDDSLNPPGDGFWDTGHNVAWGKFRTTSQYYDFAIQHGTAYFNWIISLRTSYSLAETVNEWRKRYEQERDDCRTYITKIQNLDTVIRWREARIDELETDYVKKLEQEIIALKELISRAGNEAATLSAMLSKGL